MESKVESMVVSETAASIGSSSRSTSGDIATGKKKKKKKEGKKKEDAMNNDNGSNNTDGEYSEKVTSAKKTGGGEKEKSSNMKTMTMETIQEELLHVEKQTKRKQKKSNMLRLRDDGFSSSTSIDQHQEEIHRNITKNPGQERRKTKKDEGKRSLESSFVGSAPVIVTQTMQESWLREYEREEQKERKISPSITSTTTILSASAQVFVPNVSDTSTRSHENMQQKKTGRKAKKKISGSVTRRVLCDNENPQKRQEKDDTEEEYDIDLLDGDACLVCAKSVNYFAVGKCGHPICSLCAMRLRLKSKEKDCVVCKTFMEQMLVFDPDKTTHDEAVATIATGEIEGLCGPSLVHDPIAGLHYLDCPGHAKDMENIRSMRCPVKGCDQPFPTEKKLFSHLNTVHKLNICTLCHEHRPLFLYEHTLYQSTKELNAHIKKEHTICMFCRRNVFDPSQLYIHMRDNHRSCPHCPRRFEFRYYKDEVELKIHVKNAHYICPICDCLEAAFPTHGLFSDHMLAIHGKTVSNKVGLGQFLGQEHGIAQYIDLQSVDEDEGDDDPYFDSSNNVDIYASNNGRNSRRGTRARQQNNGRNDFYSSADIESRRNPLMIAPNMRVAGRVTGTGTFTVDADSLALEEYCESLHRGGGGNQGGPSNRNHRGIRGRMNNDELFPSLATALSQSSLDTNVDSSTTEQSVKNNEANNDKIQLYVGNLPEYFELEVFQNIVDAFGGQSIGIRLATDKRTDKMKGFGYVDFACMEAATLVLNNMKEYEIDGKQLKVELVERKKKGSTSTENPLAILARQEREKKAAEAMKQRELREDQERRKKERQKQLAEAMGVALIDDVLSSDSSFSSSVNRGQLSATFYPNELLEFAIKNKMEIMKVEKKLADLIKDEKATSVQMKPMQKPVRLLLHTLAKFYNVNSYEYDPEPNRYVSFVKLLDSRLPANMLSTRCMAKRFHNDFTIYQLPIDDEYPFTLSFCRRTLEPGEDPSANMNYGSTQELRSMGMSRMENIPTLTSASELLLQIQLCNGNKRLSDNRIDSSHGNALIVHLKFKDEAEKVFDACASNRAICLRYSIEHRGWSNHEEVPQHDVQTNNIMDMNMDNVNIGSTFDDHDREVPIASWEDHSLRPSKDAFFEDSEIEKPCSFKEATTNCNDDNDGVELATTARSAYQKAASVLVNWDEADLIDAGFEAEAEDKDEGEER